MISDLHNKTALDIILFIRMFRTHMIINQSINREALDQ